MNRSENILYLSIQLFFLFELIYHSIFPNNQLQKNSVNKTCSDDQMYKDFKESKSKNYFSYVSYHIFINSFLKDLMQSKY